ncbi:7TM diverse intracellular signaling domain-containing protein [Mucilaginibacter terrae]|uniref:Chromosome partitioning protein ParA n=1 Tax=Mucilaginibacter terrae TaxID=1955052 RepID=A0ABU3GQQ0_9SPHI|nr:7TM diverse intracellular signaling domain-containing protein [Mucilaginibacter terrae]MDT3402103.1 hypothetical protein [Mucilaginibacter terrae]
MIRLFTNLTFIICMVLSHIALAQTPVNINNKVEQHIFGRREIEFLKDEKGKLTFTDVKKADVQNRFSINKKYYPDHTPGITYWYKIKVNVNNELNERDAIIEFFDQTTNQITAYLPTGEGQYVTQYSGADQAFKTRLYQHKNFEFSLTHLPKGTYTCYFKVRARDGINVIIVYRTVTYFIKYALTEYLTYGLFYGIILIFSFHNLLMFMAMKRREYLYYVLYILSVGLFEMCTDGIAFQYLWPNAPDWNQYAYGVTLFAMSIFALEFTKSLLHVHMLPRLNRLINGVIALRTAYFVYCLLFNKGLFYYKFVEFIPLSVAFGAGIIIWQKGYKPARFFVLGYTFLFSGFVIKALSVLGLAEFIPGVITNYVNGISFVLEMLFLSFSIGDQVRLLRREKEAAHEATIRQMNINFELKDSLNKELEVKVEERTREVVEKSKEIFSQAHTIEEQNKELVTINTQLEQQAAEISRMNVLLEKDNTELKTNIEKVTDARALSKELSFEEFSLQYPDQEKCNKFLSEIKWEKGYTCIKCGHEAYKNGRAPYSRRCGKCNYEESVLYNTIFQNNRIPINKAFYIVYLIYTTKGAISSYQLSDKLSIRQSTCWQYAMRIKKVLEDHKGRSKKETRQGWSKLILDKAPPVQRSVVVRMED